MKKRFRAVLFVALLLCLSVFLSIQIAASQAPAVQPQSSQSEIASEASVGKTVKVRHITVSPSKLTLSAGKSRSLTAHVTPKNATNAKVRWTSNHSNIVSVNSSTGRITAKTNGTAIITARARDGSGAKDTCRVTVPKVRIKSITIPSKLTMKVGDKQTLKATISPSRASNKNLRWSTNRSSIVKVDKDTGELEARKAGTAQITVRAKDGSGAKDTCNVTVENADVKVTGITIKTVPELSVGETYRFKATITPKDATNKGLNWTSSDSSVIRIIGPTSGNARILKAGSAVITATAKDGSGVKANRTVTVKSQDVKVTGIAINEVPELKAGQTFAFSASVTPENASNKSLVWSSSDSSVLSITNSTTGQAQALKAGSATVTAAAQDGSGVTASKTISVAEDAPVEPTGSTVYMTTDISPAGLQKAYDALNWTPEGKVAVKISTGEPPASNYLKPELIGDLVKGLKGTIVECNTAYGGSRASTEMHMQVAEDHGFTKIADVDILDGEDTMRIPVTGGSRLKEDIVGSHFDDYDSYLILSHFKGHSMAGFGGAIKNSSIGLGSSSGKALIHSGGTSETNPWSGQQEAFTESMAEANKAVSDYLDNGKNIVYINVLNNISIDCDCSGYPAEPEIPDIGILASTDPVALDQASLDLCYEQEGSESLKRRVENRQGEHTLEHGEEIGLGSRDYNLVSLD